MKSIVAERFVECLDTLKEHKEIRSYRQFALSLDFKAQNLNQIRQGNRDVPRELIQKAIDKYRFSPVFLFTGSGPKFLSANANEAHTELVVAVDHSGTERIIHVPIRAQSDYCAKYRDASYIAALPHYSLPEMRFQSGSYRSFELLDQRMEPSLNPHDKVLGRYIEKQYWHSGIKDNNVYIIVTHSEVLINRVINRLKDGLKLIAISDNDYFPPAEIILEDIREIWIVELVFRNFLHAPARFNKSTVKQNTEDSPARGFDILNLEDEQALEDLGDSLL